MSGLYRRFLPLLAAIAVIGIGIAVFMPASTSDLDTADLANRVGRARVTWADYGEEIKAELGATPAALWHGIPVSARLTDGGIEVTFSLSGVWSELDFGMPILLRDPEGKVHSRTFYTRAAPGGTYLFLHDGPITPLSMPWVEVKFPPNDERRIVFDSTGSWRSTAR